MRRGTGERERAGRAGIGGGASSRKLQDSASASPTQDKRRRDIASLLETFRDLSALSSHLVSSSPVSSVLVWSCLPCAFRFHRSSVGRPSFSVLPSFSLSPFFPFSFFLPSFLPPFLSFFIFCCLCFCFACVSLFLSFDPVASLSGRRWKVRKWKYAENATAKEESNKRD